MLLWDDLPWWSLPPALPATASERIAQEWCERANLILNGYSGFADVDAAAVADFARRFEARWGDLSLATLVRVAQHYAETPADLGLALPPDWPARWDTAVASAHSRAAQASRIFNATFMEQSQWMPIREVVEGEGEGQTEVAAVAYEAVFTLTLLGIILTRRPRDAVTAQAADALARYLAHRSPYARWSSAFWLGWLGDARALPHLAHMLTEFLPPHTLYYPAGDRNADFFYESYRPLLVPLILHVWRASLQGHSSRGGGGTDTAWLVGMLRQALLAVLALEESLPRPQELEQESFASEGAPHTGQEAVRKYHSHRQPWINLQHQIVYALGRLGAFGALMGVPMPRGIYHSGPSWQGNTILTTGGGATVWHLANAYAEDHAGHFRADLWRVEACCGALEAEYYSRLDGHQFDFESVPAFAPSVAQLLEQQFGLTEVEQRQAIEDYDKAGYFFVTAEYYQRVAQEEQWAADGSSPSRKGSIVGDLRSD